MKKVAFEGWDVGMKKISFYKMIKSKSHLTLKESKSISDKILRNEIVIVEFENSQIAYEICQEAIKLGVKCKLLD